MMPAAWAHLKLKILFQKKSHFHTGSKLGARLWVYTEL